MPPLPPVTTATRPLRSNSFVNGIAFPSDCNSCFMLLPIYHRCSDWRAKSMTSLTYLFQVEDSFDSSFGGSQHAQMGGVDPGRPNVTVTRHSLHYSIKMLCNSIGGAADGGHTNMGRGRQYFHRVRGKLPTFGGKGCRP